MTATELVGRLQKVRRTTSGWEALCPAHHDHNASLSIAAGADGRVLLHCYAGCPTEEIVRALGLSMSDLFADHPDPRPKRPTADQRGGRIHPDMDAARKAALWGVQQKDGVGFQIAGEWLYSDAAGEEVARVIRFENPAIGRKSKVFRPICKDGDSWRVGDPSGQWPLYGAHELLRSEDQGRTILLLEGEGKTEAARSLGLLATTSAHGAKSAKKTDWTRLAGCTVAILPDNDSAGEEYAQEAAGILAGLTPPARILIVRLPGLPAGGDMVEFLAARKDRPRAEIVSEIQALVAASPRWASQAPSTVAMSSDDESRQIKARFFEISQMKGLSAAEKRQTMADVVLDALHQHGRFFFHAVFKDFPTCMFFDSRRKLLLPIASDQFHAWLSGYIGINRIERSFNFILAAIQDEALTDKRTTGLTPEICWAAKAGAVYMSNGDGQAVKITAGNFALVDNGTDDVLFCAGRTLSPWQLTAPVNPMESCRLFREMKAISPHAKDLFLLWVLSLLTNQRCKPPLVLSGPVGSGKTRLAVGVFELFGITPRILKLDENKEADFWTSLDSGGIVCFDNADTHIKWLPDSLSAAATDGINEKRRLYTNTDMIQQRARAWAMVTSANPTFASDAGLSDRLLLIRLQRRDADTAESVLSDEIAQHRDAGLSFVAHTLSKALADTAPVAQGLNRRHPDFAAFAVRLGRALGREAQAVEALRAAEEDKAKFNLENDDVGTGLIDLMQRSSFLRGTSAELLDALKEVDSCFDNPKWNTKRLGKRLAKLWPHLEDMYQAKAETGHGRVVTYTFERSGEDGEFKRPISDISHARDA